MVSSYYENKWAYLTDIIDEYFHMLQVVSYLLLVDKVPKAARYLTVYQKIYKSRFNLPRLVSNYSEAYCI